MGYKQPVTLATLTETGTAVSGQGVLTNFHLAAGSDAATAVIRDGGINGPIRAKLTAVTNTSDDLSGCFRFTNDCYVTLTGTSPVFTFGVVNPQANQLNPS